MKGGGATTITKSFCFGPQLVKQIISNYLAVKGLLSKESNNRLRLITSV